MVDLRGKPPYLPATHNYTEARWVNFEFGALFYSDPVLHSSPLSTLIHLNQTPLCGGLVRRETARTGVVF